MSPNDLKSRVMLININLRWDGGRGVVVGAVGRFHLSPSQYPYAEVRGLRIPYGELDWNDLSQSTVRAVVQNLGRRLGRGYWSAGIG